MRVTRVIVVRGFSPGGTVTAVYIPSSFCKVSLDTKALSRSLITSKSCWGYNGQDSNRLGGIVCLAHLFHVRKFLPNPIDVHDFLCWVLVAE